MYTEFFHLLREPFSIAPDPRYVFMSERHREALAHLLYGVGSGGFVLLTGEIGAGKTTICRCFLEQIPPNCKVAYIFNPKLTVFELLASICEEFGLAVPKPLEGATGIKPYIDALNNYLLASHAQGRNNVLIIDEAQNLSSDVLEQLRLLTNLETNERKLLQILLIGQPELNSMLAKPELRQLAQRIVARYHLGPLSPEETAGYVRHRLAVAGMTHGHPFGSRIMPRVHRYAQGVPRRINLLCDRALLGAYVEEKQTVDRRILAKAAHEVFGPAPGSSPRRGLRLVLIGGLGALGIGVGAWGLHAGGDIDGLQIPKQWIAAWEPKPPSQTSREGNGHIPEPDRVSDAGSPAGLRGRAERVKPAQDNVAESAASSSAGQEKQALPMTQQAAVAPLAGANAIAPAEAVIFGQPQKEEAIYRELAHMWGVALPDGGSCKFMRSMELHCYQGSGGLAELRLLDRPAALTLQDEAGIKHYAILTGLSASSATIRVGGRDQTVSLMALGRYFHGDFSTFWRAPAVFRDQVRSGDRGPDVDWIAARLGSPHGVTAAKPNRLFDAALTSRVQAFQGAQGLAKDGVVGPKTFIFLNRVTGIDEPRLNAQASSKLSVPIAATLQGE